MMPIKIFLKISLFLLYKVLLSLFTAFQNLDEIMKYDAYMEIV